MNCSQLPRRLTGALFVLLALPVLGFAQGALLPAGAPAPTMKTLQQIESRVDVATLPGDATAVWVISQPGSYYLTADVVGTAGKHGVRIDCSDVTLDLNGFSIRGPGAGSFHGVFAPATDADTDPTHIGYVVVKNGVVRDWGYAGVSIGGTTGSVVSEVRVHDCAAGGVYLNGGASRVERCVVQNVVGVGINVVGDDKTDALVRECVVARITNPAGAGVGVAVIQGLIEHCRVSGVTGGTGATGILQYESGGRVAHCDVAEIRATGATGYANGITSSCVADCTVQGVTGVGASSVVRGIFSSVALRVSGCRISGLSGYQVHGIDGSVAESTGESFVQSCQVQALSATGSANGIAARTVLDCQVAAVDGPSAGASANGIVVLEGGLASRCAVRNTEGNGIYAWYSSNIVECSIDKAGTDGTGAGIFSLNNARIERNRVSGSPIGIQQGGVGLVIGNYAGSNTTNYSGVNAAQIVSSYAAVAAGSSTQNVSF